MLEPVLQKFIEENIHLIEQGKFEELYYKGTNSEHALYYPGKLTDVLYDIGIDPLEKITTVPMFYLDGSSMKTFTVPEHVVDAKRSAFAYSTVPLIKLHDDFEISPSCFARSQIESIRIPDLMIEVPDECFYGCKLLTTVDLNKVSMIGSHAFSFCDSLRDIYISENVFAIDDNAFRGSKNVTLVIDKGNDFVAEWAMKHGKAFRYI